jgi:hypothetical protein
VIGQSLVSHRRFETLAGQTSRERFGWFAQTKPVAVSEVWRPSEIRACTPSEDFRFPLYLFCTYSSGFASF